LSFLFSWFVIEVLTFQNFGSDVTGVAFHPTKNLVASCSHDKSVKLWNADTGAELWTVKVDGRVNSVAFSPDTTLAAGLGAPSNSVLIFDAQSGEIKSSLNVGSYVWSVQFSPNGDTIAAGCNNGTVQIIDVATAEVKRPLSCDSPVNSIDWHENRIAAGCRDGTIKAFDAQSGDCLSTVRGHSAVVRSVCFSSDGKKLMKSSEDSTVRNWDPATRASLS